MRILDSEGELVFEDETSTANMRRSITELIGFLRREQGRPAIEFDTEEITIYQNV